MLQGKYFSNQQSLLIFHSYRILCSQNFGEQKPQRVEADGPGFDRGLLIFLSAGVCTLGSPV